MIEVDSPRVPPAPPSSAWSDVLTFSHIAWRGRWVVLASAVVCAVLVGVYAFTAKSWYRAQVTLLPVENKSAQGLLGQLGPLSGLAGLAGISLDGGGRAEPIAVLRSRDFLRDFIERKQLLTVLFADRWDAQQRKWTTTPSKTPDIRDAVKFFDEDVRRIGEDRKLSLVTLTVDWTDAQTAADWANQMAVDINAKLRASAIEDAEKSIAYLREQLATANQVALQQSISRLIESQMQTLMVARGNEEYAFRVIDTAHPAKKRFKPYRSLLIIGGAFVGALLACVFLVVRTQLRSAKLRSNLNEE
ncbi:MAG TPA: Wzz/FepE/Etk N-terminal domain-containing protein [Steroidobacteraceae bacterium]|nr:Wzz/FepE/Etk N-terminal domain-containing protein [Steroidobacteraceae bacterium]